MFGDRRVELLSGEIVEMPPMPPMSLPLELANAPPPMSTENTVSTYRATPATRSLQSKSVASDGSMPVALDLRLATQTPDGYVPITLRDQLRILVGGPGQHSKRLAQRSDRRQSLPRASEQPHRRLPRIDGRSNADADLLASSFCGVLGRPTYRPEYVFAVFDTVTAI